MKRIAKIAKKVLTQLLHHKTSEKFFELLLVHSTSTIKHSAEDNASKSTIRRAISSSAHLQLQI